MRIRVGYELIYDFPQPTPMIMVLGAHPTRAADVIVSDALQTDPVVQISPYRDLYGNWCSRLVAPAGRMRLSGDGIVHDSGLPEPLVPTAPQHAVEDLPAETIVYLLGSRYCETDRLTDIAWQLFGNTPRAGRASRRSAIMSITTSPSATSMRVRPRRRARPSTNATACAATMPTSRSRSAAA